MKIKVNTTVDLTCEGCGASTRLTPAHKYDLSKDIMCNCGANSEPVDITPSVEVLTAHDVNDVIMGLANGATLEQFDESSQKMYAEFMVEQFDNDIADGVTMNNEDVRVYAEMKAIIGGETPEPLTPEVPEFDTITVEDIRGIPVDELLEMYDVELQLRPLAVELKVAKASQLKDEQKLVKRLLEKVE